MQTKYCKCPECDHTNKVEIPENFDDKVQRFIESAPVTTIGGLLSLGAGIFIAPPVGFGIAGAMLAASIFTDGTAKCTKCGSRFRIA
jgi:hypothetical protein